VGSVNKRLTVQAIPGIKVKPYLTNSQAAKCWWFKPIILATQEAEIRRIMIRSQSGKIV
jgi:hypothetical protein